MNTSNQIIGVYNAKPRSLKTGEKDGNDKWKGNGRNSDDKMFLQMTRMERGSGRE